MYAYKKTPKPRLRTATYIVVVAMLSAASIPSTCFADEAGVSFWYPGTYASLAAQQQEPGWSLTVTDYYATLSASGETAFLARGDDIGGACNNLLNKID